MGLYSVVVFEGSREDHFFFDAAPAPLRVDAVEIVEVVDAALDMVFVDDLEEEVKGILIGVNAVRRCILEELDGVCLVAMVAMVDDRG